MARNDFDTYAENYQASLDAALSIGGGDSVYYAERKFASLQKFYRERAVKSPATILDFGCGTGTNLPFLRELFPSAILHGVDVSTRSIEVASERGISDCHLTHYNGVTLPFAPAVFDLVVVSNVLHHIDPPDRESALKELARCMRPGGILVVFEHNPHNPVTRKVVRDCPFDVGVSLVAQRELAAALTTIGFQLDILWNIIFMPAALKNLNVVERYLRWLPLGAQYALFAKRQG